MSRCLLKLSMLISLFLGSNSLIVRSSYAYQSSTDRLLSDIETQLRKYTEAEIGNLRTQAQRACATAILELSKTATGYGLAHDLRLSSLNSLLQTPQPSLRELQEFEEQLRHLTPGRNQAYLDELQKQVSALRRVLATNEETLPLARNAIAQLREAGREQQFRESNPAKIQSAFSALNMVAIDPVLLRKLQTTLSTPNVQSQFRIRTLERIGRTSFSIPVQSSTCSDRTDIDIHGKVSVKLSPSFAQSKNAIPIFMAVEGQGVFDVTASRAPARVHVDLTAVASGVQPIELHPLAIERKTASVDVDVSSRLRNVSLTGHLNRSRLLRNLLGRAIEKKLADQDRVLSTHLEREISRRAEEEGYKLAFKINRLMSQSLWSRLESVHFAPDIHLSANDKYLVSHSLYAFPEQLGALSDPPTLPSHCVDQLDWTTHIHQSAINNILCKTRNLKLSEATMRGVWKVQLNLESPKWQTPVDAVIPWTITLAAEDPIWIELSDQRLNVELNLSSAMQPSSQLRLPPITAAFSYSLARQEQRYRIVRSFIKLPAQLSPREAAAWKEVLERFFPESLQPIPKFRPSMWENHFALKYLNAASGWLSVGLSDISREHSSISLDTLQRSAQ